MKRGRPVVGWATACFFSTKMALGQLYHCDALISPRADAIGKAFEDIEDGDRTGVHRDKRGDWW